MTPYAINTVSTNYRRVMSQNVTAPDQKLEHWKKNPKKQTEAECGVKGQI